jgi:hypothetical protein
MFREELYLLEMHQNLECNYLNVTEEFRGDLTPGYLPSDILTDLVELVSPATLIKEISRGILSAIVSTCCINYAIL